jgi:hypothetical protein
VFVDDEPPSIDLAEHVGNAEDERGALAGFVRQRPGVNPVRVPQRAGRLDAEIADPVLDGPGEQAQDFFIILSVRLRADVLTGGNRNEPPVAGDSPPPAAAEQIDVRERMVY